MNLTRLLQGSLLRNEDVDSSGGDTPPVDDTYQSNDINVPKDFPVLLDSNLNLSEGYQKAIGEYAEGTNYKNLKDVFKSNKEVQRALSQKAEENAQLRRQLEELGDKPPVEVPSSVEEFRKAIELPQELPDGFELSEDVLNIAAEYAMEKGYGPKELSDFLAFDVKRAEMEIERQKNESFAKIESAKQTIIDQVGEQNYDMTIANAKFVSEALQLPLDANDLVSQPNMVVALSKIRKSIGEGTLKGATVNGVEISNGSKLEQANDIVSNPENKLYAAFNDPSHPQHEWAQQEHARLITESMQ